MPKRRLRSAFSPAATPPPRPATRAARTARVRRLIREIRGLVRELDPV